jgi:adenylate cyclase
MSAEASDPIGLADLQLCFEGAIPAVIATASAAGLPNITYLSRVRQVDHQRIALSNQFFSKTSRNLAENPQASVLLVDPTSYDEFRLTIVYERTERHGPVFERLRDDVDTVAALEGMQDVFKLRTADIYRVQHIERRRPSFAAPDDAPDVASRALQLAEVTARLGRCADLDTLVMVTVDSLDELLGFEHSMVLLRDERGERLYTIASRGYDAEGVGSEVTIGEGTIGMAAARCASMRLGNLGHMARYSRSMRRAYERSEGIGPGHDIPVPGLALVESRLAVPAVAAGQLVGVLVVESNRTVAFDETDEALLGVIAAVVANAIELHRVRDAADDEGAPTRAVASHPVTSTPPLLVRFFPVDGSTFLDGDYLIKGVAGRILWSLLGHYERDGREEFTNREVRLDPSLELPEFRDNLESRLILLKRRLDERRAPIRIEKTGRGRFRLLVDAALQLEAVAPDPD